MGMSRRNALMIGNNADAPYHPLDAVREEMGRILRDDFQVASSADYGLLAGDNLSRYDLCISYADRWDDPVTAEQAAGLIAYVAGGGGLLVVHNGISLQAKPELGQMIGAKFTEHPAYTELEFEVTAADHPVMEGIGPFVLAEEPYRFDFDPFCDKEVLLAYRHEGREWPAAWAHAFGLGKVVFLMPGHHLPSFRHAEYAKLLRNGVKWVAR
ncbi:ThuA domain-containing protein [Paenibacillus macerans]|uniref:ThuA domain-containing protein n=1 Tax=Paenibacillus macerans TaxID=44252 RepID=UPI003D3162BF